MATHAGAFYFDARPMHEERRWLTVSLQSSSFGVPSVFSADGIAMACDRHVVWSRQKEENGGLARSESGLVIVWDGRLDNREDLCLRLYGALARKESDAAIALAVFDRWRLDGLRALIGDWSLTIWESSSRTVHLARDYMGVRPLYYHVDREGVRWSSSLAELAVRSGCADDLDEAFVARFMTLQSSTDVTPYVGIRAVPTATCVSIDANGVEVRRKYWSLSPGRLRYSDPRHYEERLRELWREAVGVRLRTEGTAWAELSGGLDSSSIVCMADALIKGARVDASAIQPFSHVTMESPEGDERRFIAVVEDRIGMRSEILGVEEHMPRRDPHWDWVTPRAVQGVQVAAHERIHDAGGRVILSGRLGDLVMGCAPDNSGAVFDDLAEGRPFVALAKMRAWSRARRVPFLEIAGQLARESVRAAAGRPFTLPPGGTQVAGGELLVDRLRAQVSNQTKTNDEGRGARLSHAETRYLLELTARQAQLEVHSDPSAQTYTYPFSHRPLVEFMVSIPSEQLSAPGDLRSLMRRAFAGLVPERILRRISKGYYPPVVARGARSRASSLLPEANAGIVRRGWVDPLRLEGAVRALLDGRTDTAQEVYRLVQLEQWLESRDRWGPTAMPQRKEVNTNAVLSA